MNSLISNSEESTGRKKWRQEKKKNYLVGITCECSACIDVVACIAYRIRHRWATHFTTIVGISIVVKLNK